MLFRSGLSRNKVAVPEGAAGTPPFWRGPKSKVSGTTRFVSIIIEKDEAESMKQTRLNLVL